MNRITTIIFALVLIVILASCGSKGPKGNMDIKSQAILTAKIMSIDSFSLLLASMNDGANRADIYTVNVDGVNVVGLKGESVKTEDLQSGMLIDVHFDGIVRESFPLGIGNVEAIVVKEEQQDDLVNFYLSVIDDLFNTDEGLNGGISMLAFNLNEVSNLSETEKTALVYLAGNKYNLETTRGTFDELVEQGYIDKEKLYFENGLLIDISVTNTGNNRFVFNASKWRSGLGAYFFHECTAEKKNGKWTYKIGAHMIS